MRRSGLIIFAKYPTMSKVKSRLAKTTSDQFALDVYNICAANIFESADELRSKSPDIDIILFYAGNTEPPFRAWIKKDFIYYQQTGKSLGERLANAFEVLFKKGYSKLAVVGTDVPDHTSGELKNAFDTLVDFETVLGPSPDGGYYLLGMKRFLPELFENIEWSSENVYAATLEKIKRLNMTVDVLPELYDLDDESDLKEWLRLPGAQSSVKAAIEKIYNKFTGTDEPRFESAGD